MYEDHTVEERYLTNFSQKEKDKFRLEQEAKRSVDETYGQVIDDFFKHQSYFAGCVISCDDRQSSCLEIKYVLNRIANNDPRDTVFNLTLSDKIENGDEWATPIANGFKHNSACTWVKLQIGLSDEGAKLILDVLQHKKLSVLDLTGNNFSSKTFNLLNEIVSNPENTWRVVYVNPPAVKDEIFDRLRQNSKVVVEEILPVEKAPAKTNTETSFMRKIAQKFTQFGHNQHKQNTRA